MISTSSDAAAHAAIQNLIHRWGVFRDSDDWPALATCFHPGARVHLSWIRGLATEFVQRSQVMASGRRPGMHMKHITASPTIERRDGRAFCRSNALLVIRDEVQGHWFDLEMHMRFLDRIEWRVGQWRIVERTAVYDKDRIDAVSHDRSQAPPWANLSVSVPDPVMHGRWWLGTRGLQPRDDMVFVYSQEEKALLARATAWLEYGTE